MEVFTRSSDSFKCDLLLSLVCCSLTGVFCSSPTLAAVEVTALQASATRVPSAAPEAAPVQVQSTVFCSVHHPCRPLCPRSGCLLLCAGGVLQLQCRRHTEQHVHTQVLHHSNKDTQPEP